MDNVSRARRLTGIAIHAFTALGTVCALLALIAISSHQWREALLWLGVALAIDSVNGTMARAVDIKRAMARPLGLSSFVGDEMRKKVLVTFSAVAVVSGAGMVMVRRHSGAVENTGFVQASALAPAPPAIDDLAATRAILDAGVPVKRLSVRSSGDIVVLRGTGDAAAAVAVLQSLGATRVANLITAAPPAKDEGVAPRSGAPVDCDAGTPRHPARRHVQGRGRRRERDSPARVAERSGPEHSALIARCA